MAEPVQILVVGPSWIGDMVMAQSLFISLKQQYPEAQIDVLAPGWSAPIVERMEQVRECVNQPVAHGSVGLKTRYRLGRSLRQKKYELAIVLPRSYKAALIPFFAGIKHRVGFRGEFRYGVINDVRPLNKQVLSQTVQRFVALGQARSAVMPPSVPFPSLRLDQSNRDRVLGKLGLDPNKKIVGIMHGAEYGPAKCWPHFGQLASALAQQDIEVWLFGSDKDRTAGDKIAQGNKAVKNLCGRTSLADAVDLLSVPELVVCNDSGLMHMAAATGQQILAIYGSSTPDYTPPLTDRALIMYDALSCSPCFKRQCPLGHTNCLENIGVERVMEGMKSLQSNQGGNCNA